MIRCPHCQKAGVPMLRKAILSPGLLARCKLCQGESTLHYRGWLSTMTPGSLLLVAALFAESPTSEWLLNGTGLGLLIALPLWLAPLHPE